MDAMTRDAMYTVIIQSINEHDEVEWTEKITSETSLQGAMNKATRWIKAQLFSNIKLTKALPLSDKYVVWWIH